MTDPRSQRAPGRPKDAEKRRAIVAAAKRLFVKSTYEGVTMEQVAAAAGVAKMTVYGHFHDKETLFEAVVRASADGMIASLSAIPGVDGDLQAALTAFGTAFLGMVLDPDLVSAHYRLFDLLSRHRALAERFHDAGPGRMRVTLAEFLREAATRGELSLDDPGAAAADLLSLWLGDMQHALALGLVQPLTAAQIDRRVRRGIQVFLRAYAPVHL
jgi:TetR/AcrR family transcriptional repressor of mexJK operon